MTMVVTLTVRIEAIESFRAYERAAARAMARYGGAIERAVVIPATNGGTSFKEIHIVTFPDEAAFNAYQGDEEMAALSHLRAGSVIGTEIMFGEDGPDYRS
jgi:uncharacterized protein (DUF1330 family)